MDKFKLVNVNGRQYDPVSGLPIGDETPRESTPLHIEPTAPRSVHAGSVHTVTQKSKTLRRSSLKRPTTMEPIKPQNSVVINKKPALLHQDVVRHPQVSKFVAPAPTTTPEPQSAPKPRMMDIGPVKHPHVVKAQAQIDAKRTLEPPKPSKIIKQEAIRTAIENTVKQTKAPQRGFRHPRVASILTAALALVLLGGYLTYLNMPSLSVRVAAAAAGVDASYPDYRPDGYSLSGPVTYDQGHVSMQFAANAGPQKFTVKQSKSSWDSDAVLNNYVTPKAGSDYATYTERGLTIYTFDGGVAWVNGGILYTIEGDARLSSEQIRHLATSFI